MKLFLLARANEDKSTVCFVSGVHDTWHNIGWGRRRGGGGGKRGVRGELQRGGRGRGSRGARCRERGRGKDQEIGGEGRESVRKEISQDLDAPRLQNRDGNAGNKQMRIPTPIKDGCEESLATSRANLAGLSGPDHRVAVASSTLQNRTGITETSIVAAARRGWHLLLGPFLQNIAEV